jgi:hypothetical protein
MKNYNKKKVFFDNHRRWNKMMQKSTTFTMIVGVKKCHIHYDMQKNMFRNDFRVKIEYSKFIFSF